MGLLGLRQTLISFVINGDEILRPSTFTIVVLFGSNDIQSHSLWHEKARDCFEEMRRLDAGAEHRLDITCTVRLAIPSPGPSAVH